MFFLYTQIISKFSASYVQYGSGEPARADRSLACVPVPFTLFRSLPLIQNYRGAFFFMWATPDDFALVCPSFTAQQTEIFTDPLLVSWFIFISAISYFNTNHKQFS